jgi:serine/threonine-protein kinase RsbW
MQSSVPSAPAACTLEATYPGMTNQLRYVRADLRAVLGDRPAADDVILCASELAANAVLHSRSRLPCGTFTVKVAVVGGGCIHIEVEDDGGLWSDGATVTEAGRHGLDIIQALACKWGTHGDASGRVVWAEFGWPPAAATTE